MSEAVNTASDWVAAYLPTIIAIVTSSTFVIMVLRFLLNLILLKVRTKTTKGLNDGVIAKYEALENRVNQVVGDLENLFNNSMGKYADMTKAQFSELMAQYQNVKKEYFNAVIEGRDDFLALVEQGRELKENVENTLKEITEQAKEITLNKVEEIKEEIQNDVTEDVEEVKETLIENIEEIKDEIIEEIPQEVKDGYVKVKKVYGKQE